MGRTGVFYLQTLKLFLQYYLAGTTALTQPTRSAGNGSHAKSKNILKATLLRVFAGNYDDAAAARRFCLHTNLKESAVRLPNCIPHPPRNVVLG